MSDHQQPARRRGPRPPATRRPATPADDWEGGADAATYSTDPPPAPPPPAPHTPAEYGRVRVYPTYTFPVYQTGQGGLGPGEEIRVTDWHKQGRAWAESEARRQVTAALGEPSDTAPGGAWWMGRATKDTHRWRPFKGTSRTALPIDGLPEPPPWQPWMPPAEAEPAPQPSPREAEIMRAAMTDHAGMLPESMPNRATLLEAGWVNEQGQVTALGQQATREYVRTAPGYQPDRRYEGVLARIDGYSPAETAAEAGGIGTTRDWRVQQAAEAGTPFVLRADDVQPGDRVLDTGKEELGTVREVDDRGGVVIAYDRELTPGHPGTAGVHMLSTALEAGALQKVPHGATYADLEERRPPAEQADRYAQRRAHYDEQHGPGKRGKKGWTAHKRGCRVCQDLDTGGDGVGRQLRAVAPAAPAAGPAERYPVQFTFTGGVGGEECEVRHWRWEAALDQLRDQVGGWVIPEDGAGVLDTDAFIASIGGYVGGLAGVLGRLAEELGGGQTPIAAVVGETLADFAGSLEVMSAEAGQVYQQWTDNDDNRHDLRRARGEIPGAHLFNVGA